VRESAWGQWDIDALLTRAECKEGPFSQGTKGYEP